MSAVPKLPKLQMSADEFLAWDARQLKEAGRFELINGDIIVQQSERARHVEVKLSLVIALRDSIRANKLSCYAMTDGASVRAASDKVFKPDGLVYCGKLSDPDAVEIPNPVIVFEVLSKDSHERDHGDKVPGYFSIDSVQHNLIVDPRRRVIIHHRRGPGEDLLTRVRKSGRLTFDPPGLSIDVAAVFEREA